MKARLTFLSGPLRGRRRVLKDRIISIGGDRAHTIHLPDLAPADPLALVEERDCTYTITARHPLASLTVNGVGVGQTVLQDGDLIRLAGTHTIRFGVVPDRGDVCKPMRQIVRESAGAAANFEAGPLGRSLFFLRDVCHCTACDATSRVKLACVLTCGLVVLASVLGGVSLFQSQVESDQRVIALSEQVAAGTASRRRLEQQVFTLRQIEGEKARTEARLGQVSQELETAQQRLARLEREKPDLVAAIEAARPAVAFLLVAYALHDRATGQPLRFASVDANGEPQPGEEGNYETSTGGSGPVVTSYAMGSAFLISGGRMVTNRHIAEPWREEPSVDAAIQHGFEPRRTMAYAYFPGMPRRVDLQVATVSTEADIAVMKLATPSGLAGLTLAPLTRHVSAGDLIVVIGYPTGFDALLARTDHVVAQEIVNTAGDDWSMLANALADRRLITPLVTVGHVGDVLGNNIVYDAATTHGSSGGPVLNAAGEVIALNYAGLAEFAGARFGIPVRLVHRLLNEHHMSNDR